MNNNDSEILDGLENNIDIKNLRHIPAFYGSTVYHYTSPGGLLGIIKPQGCAKLWFTQYDSLNDRTERLDIIESLGEYCENKVKEKIFSLEFAERIKSLRPDDSGVWISKNERGENEGHTEEYDIYLCCFSRENDLLPMWNYYSKSKNHEGYSIGFKRDDFKNGKVFERKYELELKSVIYSCEQKNEIFDKLFLPLNSAYELISDASRWEIIYVAQRFINEYQLVFKNSCFEHEKEVRAILKIPKSFVKNEQVSERRYRDSNGYIVPYVEYTCPKNSIVSVTTAPLLEKELAQKNLKKLLEDGGYNKIKINSSNIPIRF